MILFSLNADAQDLYNPPDYKAIKQATSDTSSPWYYHKLYSRYLKGDTTLDIQEYRMLYYGFNFHKNNEDNFSSKYALESELASHMREDKPNAHNYKSMLKLTKEYLRLSPFDMEKLFSLYNIYIAVGDTSKANIYLHITQKIFDAIMSTGDGLTEQTAFHVSAVGDEYFILNALGYSMGSHHTTTENHCDYLAVAENEDGIDGLYFDVKQIFANYRQLYENNNTNH